MRRVLAFPAIVLASCAISSCCAQEPFTKTVRIDGMHCEKCEASIEQSVTAIEGVQLCEASFKDGNALIMTDNPTVMELAIDRIRKMQFTVFVSEEE